MNPVEPEPREPELLAEDEPRYLRRQKPVEIRRRKFGKQAGRRYFQVCVGVAGVALAGWLAFQGVHFLLYSPRFLLADLESIELTGNRFVARDVVLEKFSADVGRSVLLVPLDERRAALEAIPWVERASVERILPGRIRVALVERTPVAFLRLDTELALIDAYGVILERPLQGGFRFPVVAGITESLPREEREKRMQLFVQFMKEVELARPGASGHVSDVDLADVKDLRATLAGMPELGTPETGGQLMVLVRFGEGDFLDKFRNFLEHIGEWRASAGRVESVDLRFQRQVVVNPETRPALTKSGPGMAAAQNAGPRQQE